MVGGLRALQQCSAAALPVIDSMQPLVYYGLNSAGLGLHSPNNPPLLYTC